MIETQHPGNFEKDGNLVLTSVLDRDACSSLFSDVLAAYQKGNRSFIRDAAFRIHTPLPLRPNLVAALRQALPGASEGLTGFLGDRDQMVELSAITVFPGAPEQTLHQDEWAPERRVVTTFINLFPTAEEAGALRVIPGSHRENREGGRAQSLELPAGSVVLMNGKLLHGGGANGSLDRIRPVVYATFGDVDVAGATYSLLEELRLRHRLSDFLPKPLLDTSKPRFIGDLFLATPHARSMKGQRSLLLMDGSELLGELQAPDDIPYFEQLCACIGDHTEVRELAAELGLPPAQLTGTLEELWAAGLILW